MCNTTLPKWVPHFAVPQIADDLIRDNFFSPQQIQAIRDAEYHASTTEEFWRLIEEKKVF